MPSISFDINSLQAAKLETIRHHDAGEQIDGFFVHVVTMMFSGGTGTDEEIDERIDEYRDWVVDEGLYVDGGPVVE